MIAFHLALAALAGLAAAQFPPEPKGVKILKSKFHENVTISYKEPGICEETEGVKSYAGYVHLPPGFLDDINGEKQDYPVNTFFYFFEARLNPETAPLAIWLNGGPGGSSLLGLFSENGPCLVNDDSKTTRHNPHSWNNLVNMLYIDEPTQVGFSYDTPTNVTMVAMSNDFASFDFRPTDFSQDDTPPVMNATHRAGTMSSMKPSHTTNSTAQAAHALWHFAQVWFTEFPHYKPANDLISLWAESYGGHYGPGFMRFFQQQNEKIDDGTIDYEHAHYLHLDTLGIVNGHVDSLIQGQAYIDFPYNNTYDIQVFDEPTHAELMHNWTTPGGCRDQTIACQDKLKRFDVATVNRGLVSVQDHCDIADWCQGSAIQVYADRGGHSWFDITHPDKDPEPAPAMLGYLSQPHVLEALGVPVNFSFISPVVANNFASTHDVTHGGFLDAMAYLLDSGVKVHMMYGDRDYACSWIGGEQASLAVPYSRQERFARSPYGIFWSPEGFSGMTRQLGNFSFTRIFQAGHTVPSYQPEAAHAHFKRAMFNMDMASGTAESHDDLESLEGGDRWFKNEVPEKPEPRCYILQPGTCTDEVWEKVVSGEAVIKDYWVVDEDKNDDDLLDEL